MNRTNRTVGWMAAMVVNASFALTAQAFPTSQTTAFTYQGVLKNSGAPVNAGVDLQFKLFDALVAGNQIGASLGLNAVSVSDGLFSASLDFGALAFNGEERWLEIAVASPASGGAGPFTTLTPRQKLASAPYAAYALSAGLSGTYANAVNLNNGLNTFNGSFTGNGFGLTSLNPLALSGLIDSSNIGGTYANAVSFSNSGNIFTGSHGGDGSALTSLNASNLASGTLNLARLPASGNWGLSNLTLQRSLTSNINPTLTLQQTGSGSASSVRYLNSLGNHFNLGMSSAGEFGLGYNANPGLAGDLLRITPTGDMGLGVLAPTAKLHVNGDVRIDNTGTGHAQTIEAPNAFGDASILLRSASSGSQFIEFRDIGDAFYDAVVGMADGDENFTLGVNGGPRLTITPTGRVGINTIAPAQMLHVNGNARIDGSITIPATQRIMSFAPFAFNPGSSSTAYICNSGQLIAQTPAANVNFAAPMFLPDGATMTGVSLTCKDNDAAGNVSFHIQRVDLATGVSTTLTNNFSATQSPSVRTFTSLLFAIPVDNSAYAYSLQAFWTVPATASDITIVGMRVFYTVDAPLP